MATLIHAETGQPVQQQGAASFAARFTHRFLERIPVPELRDAFGRLAREIDERSRQRDLFADTVEMPAQLIPIPPDRAAEDLSLGAVLSPSQVRRYMDCPMSWWYRYVLKLPDPINAGRAVGIAVHDALGANAAQKIETKEDLDTEGVVGVYRAAIADRLDEAVLRQKDNPAELRATGEGLVRKYMDEIAPDVHPAAVEIELAGEIGGVKVRGRLDLLEEDGTIRDVKTAAKSPSGIDHLYRFQVSTYRQLAPGASGFVRLDTLVKNKKPKIVPQPWKVEGADLRTCETLYPLAQTAMRSGLYMPNRCSMNCSRDQCAYWRQCEDEFGGRVKGGEGDETE